MRFLSQMKQYNKENIVLWLSEYIVFNLVHALWSKSDKNSRTHESISEMDVKWRKWTIFFLVSRLRHKCNRNRAKKKINYKNKLHRKTINYCHLYDARNEGLRYISDNYNIHWISLKLLHVFSSHFGNSLKCHIEIVLTSYFENWHTLSVIHRLILKSHSHFPMIIQTQPIKGGHMHWLYC